MAVFCQVDPTSTNEECILALVLNYFPESQSYLVQDVENSEDLMSESVLKKDGSNQMTVSAAKVYPIPDDDGVSGCDKIKIKQEVLALYPGTTCLYPAVVLNIPSRRKKTSDFLVKFQDDDAPSRSVNPRFVLPLPGNQ